MLCVNIANSKMVLPCDDGVISSLSQNQRDDFVMESTAPSQYPREGRLVDGSVYRTDEKSSKIFVRKLQV